MTNRRTTFVAVPAIAALFAAGAASSAMAQTVVMQPVQVAPTAVVIAPSAPPAPQTEVIPAPPVAATVTTYWEPGHWNWNGASWVWIAGQYTQRVQQPTVTATWVAGQWMQQADGGYVWVAGHWQS